MSDHSAYYLPLGRDGDHEYFTATENTVSVWGDELQHGGPPIGLLARALLRHGLDPAHELTRITVDILGAIGLGENRVQTTVLRPGRQISLVQSELSVRQSNGSFRVAARAQGWRLATAETSAIERYPLAQLTPGPAELDGTIGFSGLGPLTGDWGTKGFVGTLETRIVPETGQDGRRVWVRPLLPLVAGEQTSDAEKFFTVLDVANGVGSRLEFGQWSFMNTDTTVHLYRHPIGEWTGIDAAMVTGPSGYGMTGADLFDETGPVGRSAQTLMLRPL